MIKLPALSRPQRYAGLYVYDFGTHVAVGYTAAEIAMLRGSEAHRGGTAYEIYRVADDASIELRGVQPDRLACREAVCFLRQSPDAARRDFRSLCDAARRDPLPCVVQAELATRYAFDPPNVSSIAYAASATNMVARWLAGLGDDLGDRVAGGIDVHADLIGSSGVRLDACELRMDAAFQDRSSEEVLSATDRPVQR